MPTNFFSLPAELRIWIYEDVLVSPEPITFKAGDNIAEPSLFLYKPYGLCPSILRANKAVCHEATVILYSKNQFEFCALLSKYIYKPTFITPTSQSTTLVQSAALKSFFNQIGHENASLLLYISIEFPKFPLFMGSLPGSDGLPEDCIRSLQLVRDNCPNITTLEAWLWEDRFLDNCTNYDLNPSVVEQVFGLLDDQLKAIASLKQFVINFHLGKDTKINEYTRQKMTDRGWIIKRTKMEPLHHIDFEDYLTIQRHIFTVLEPWEEEYYRRRHKLYWTMPSFSESYSLTTAP